MADKELIIRYVVDASKAKAADKDYHDKAKANLKELMTAEQVAEQAKVEFIRRANKQRIEELARASKTEQELAKEATAAKKQSAREFLESLKANLKESERVEREVRQEGMRLAREASQEERKQAQQAKESSRLAFLEKKKEHEEQSKMSRQSAEEMDQIKSSVLGLIGIGGGLAAITKLMGHFAENARTSADYIKQVVDSVERQRGQLKEIAALTGNAPTAGFAAAQAEQAGKLGLTPDQWKESQTAMEAFAGTYKKEIGEENFNELEKMSAQFAAARGLGTQDSARIMASIIGSSKKGRPIEEIKKEFAQTFGGVEKAVGFTGPLLGQFQEVVSESVGEGGDFASAKDAIGLFQAMAQRNPGEASTYTRSTLKGLRGLRGTAEGDELGLKKGMDVYQQIDAVEAATKKAVAGGQEQDQFLGKYFKDIRELGGITAALRFGVRGNTFKRAKDAADETPDDYVESGIAGHMKGEEGTKARQEAELIASQNRRAMSMIPGRSAQRDAEVELDRMHAFDAPQGLMERAGRGFAGLLGYGDRREQMINERAFANQRRAGGSDVENMMGIGDRMRVGMFGATSAEVNSVSEIAASKLAAAADSLDRAAARMAPNVPPPMNGKPNVPAQMPR